MNKWLENRVLSLTTTTQAFILEDNQHAISSFILLFTNSNLHNFWKIASAPLQTSESAHNVKSVSDNYFAETSVNDLQPLIKCKRSNAIQIKKTNTKTDTFSRYNHLIYSFVQFHIVGQYSTLHFNVYIGYILRKSTSNIYRSPILRIIRAKRQPNMAT